MGTSEATGELMGAHEAATFLGIGLPALWERRKRKVHRPNFPEPIANLRCGPIWRRADVEEYAQATTRRVTPGPARQQPPRRVELGDLTPRTVVR